ncbi:hypothetical protein E2C01_044202 [Portunus trituberculatus]|uniref:Uncharacterized protein n=1 Tax=Portunus trituberculatus TaxID=210409 RepID=A0A5B7G1M8_PORTR|nr:hypothetical protein [Portunus trituberculatus]
MFFHVASSPPSPAESDMPGKAQVTQHSVMFITGGPQSGADGSGISGTPLPATVFCLLFWYFQKDVCMCEECVGWDVMVVVSAKIYQVYQAKLEWRRTRYARAKCQDSVVSSGSSFGAGDMSHRAV